MRSRYIWTGGRRSFIDEPSVSEVGKITVGHFGGCSSAGQTKNEDGCLIFTDRQAGWEELRTGRNHIFLTTDVLIECPNDTFREPEEIFRRIDEELVKKLLLCIQDNFVKDSTTILSWVVEVREPSTMPSDMHS